LWAGTLSASRWSTRSANWFRMKFVLRFENNISVLLWCVNCQIFCVFDVFDVFLSFCWNLLI
jgi:hypothetical protein